MSSVISIRPMLVIVVQQSVCNLRSLSKLYSFIDWGSTSSMCLFVVDNYGSFGLCSSRIVTVASFVKVGIISITKA